MTGTSNFTIKEIYKPFSNSEKQQLMPSLLSLKKMSPTKKNQESMKMIAFQLG